MIYLNSESNSVQNRYLKIFLFIFYIITARYNIPRNKLKRELIKFN